MKKAKSNKLVWRLLVSVIVIIIIAVLLFLYSGIKENRIQLNYSLWFSEVFDFLWILITICFWFFFPFLLWEAIKNKENRWAYLINQLDLVFWNLNIIWDIIEKECFCDDTCKKKSNSEKKLLWELKKMSMNLQLFIKSCDTIEILSEIEKEKLINTFFDFRIAISDDIHFNDQFARLALEQKKRFLHVFNKIKLTLVDS